MAEPVPTLPYALGPLRRWLENNYPGLMLVELVLLMPSGQRATLPVPGPLPPSTPRERES